MRIRPIQFTVNQDGCHICTSHRIFSKKGYHRLRIDGKYILIHRYLWSIQNGPIPKGKIIMHTCDNRSCLNLDHLKLGTIKDNNQDRDIKGRFVPLKGINNGMSKLTNAQAFNIKYSKTKGIVLARKYNVTKANISSIRNGKTWVHI